MLISRTPSDKAMPSTFSPAEAEFESFLRRNRFMTASLKSSFQAPSIEDGTGFYVVFPDILAIDVDGGEGWCFEVKDEPLRAIRCRTWTLERPFVTEADTQGPFGC